MKNDKIRQVAELRQLIEEKGLGEALKAFDDIIADHDPAAIRALLLLNPYTDDVDWIDEMYTVIHAVESFPSDVYVPELVDSIPELAVKSPYLLDMLVTRLLNSTDEDVRLITDGLASASKAIKRDAISSLERIMTQTDKEHVQVLQNAQAVLRKLQNS